MARYRGGRPLSSDPGRVMALDYGRKRIGVAVSDPTRTIASPGGVVERPERRAKPGALPAALRARIEELEPQAILVGIPFAMDGSVGPMAEEARRFARAVEEATGIAVIEWDERLTTARAEREILSMDLPKSKRRQKGRADEMAATLMLSNYLRSAELRDSVGPGAAAEPTSGTEGGDPTMEPETP